MAYGVSRSGSDCQTIYLRRTDSPHTKTAADGGKRGEDPGRMPDIIEKVKFSSLSWMKDDSGKFKSLFFSRKKKLLVDHRSIILGFFYSRFPDEQLKASAQSGAEVQGNVEIDAGTDTKADLNHMVSLHFQGYVIPEEELIIYPASLYT